MKLKNKGRVRFDIKEEKVSTSTLHSIACDKDQFRFNTKEEKGVNNIFHSIACDYDDPLFRCPPVLSPCYIPPLLRPIAIRHSG